MGSINFTGLSSGLDTNAIVSKLLEIERRPLTVYEDERSTVEQKQSIFQNVSGLLSTFRSAVSGLSTASAVNVRTVTSSNSDIISASASSSADLGSFKISKITNLATAHSEAFIGASDATATFTAGTTFSFKIDGSTYTIDVNSLDPEDRNLNGLRNAINDAAGDKVSAAVVNSGGSTDPYKLVLQSKDTGEANRITDISTDITVTTSGGSAALATVGSEQVLGIDAQFTYNGLEIKRSSNTVSDLVDGVTLQLNGTTDTPVTLTVSQDGEKLKGKLEDFISAYNELNTVIQEQFKYDQEKGSAGILSGDATLRSIQSSLQQLVVKSVTDADGNRYSLTSIGIEFSKDNGSLSLNEDKFNEALKSTDTNLFTDLLTTQGVTSSRQAFYVSSSSKSEAGTYGITVSGYDSNGNVQGSFSYNGETYAATGTGNYLVGAAGTPVESLKIRISDGATGDLGTVDFSVGLATQFDRTLSNFVSPLTGLLPKLDNQYQEELARLDTQINAFEDRLSLREVQLKAQWADVEAALSSLNSESSSISAQLSSLSGN